MSLLRNYLARVGLALVALAFCPATASARSITVDDVFATVVPFDLELSPDGGEFLYTLKRCNVSANRYEFSLWRARTDGNTSPRLLIDWSPSGGFGAKWSPDGSRITHVQSVAGKSQVWSRATTGGEPTPLTSAPDGIRGYAWSPDGKKLAFLANNLPEPADPKPDGKPHGQVISAHTNIYMLLGNQIFLGLARTADLCSLDLASGEVRRLTSGLQVNGYLWAPDSERLAFTGGPQTPSGSIMQETSLHVVALRDATPTVVLTSGTPRGEGGKYSFAVVSWSPTGDRLAYMRRSLDAGLSPDTGLCLYTFATKETRVVTNEDDFYPVGTSYHWNEPAVIRVQNIVRGDGHLYDLSLDTGRVTQLTPGEFSDAEFAFDRANQRMVFVRQTQQSPPAIYLADGAAGSARLLVDPNAALRELAWPKSERITWRSTDGTAVEGWLYLPADQPVGQKSPLLVVVHGGPSFAVGNNFQPFASISRSSEPNLGFWPYPFWLFPQEGYAVLVPNYRGTRGYGAAFAHPTGIWKEPAEDVVTGIDHLIAAGRVDPDRVGLMGHSHGCQLGANIMAHNRRFAAGSFAEIDVNEISRYGQLGEWLVMRNGEHYYGGPPYTNLDRYVAASPLFHFAGLKTPTLLEYGAQSQVMGGLEFRRALSRNGVPHEMIVYPGTGHNHTNPTLERESLERNLDWFNYWILGRKDPAPAKAAQYLRWEKNVEAMAAMRRDHP
jgi:dipeptidyl aminopeptidase/acylaminoacyl peptidase